MLFPYKCVIKIHIPHKTMKMRVTHANFYAEYGDTAPSITLLSNKVET